jgi:hypothetical protein
MYHVSVEPSSNLAIYTLCSVFTYIEKVCSYKCDNLMEMRICRLDLIGNLSLVALITNVYQQNLVIARTGRAAKLVTRLSKLMQASHFSNCFPLSQLMRVGISI